MAAQLTYDFDSLSVLGSGVICTDQKTLAQWVRKIFTRVDWKDVGTMV